MNSIGKRIYYSAVATLIQVLNTFFCCNELMTVSTYFENFDPIGHRQTLLRGALVTAPTQLTSPTPRMRTRTPPCAAEDRGRSARPVCSGRCAGRAHPPPTVRLRGRRLVRGPALCDARVRGNRARACGSAALVAAVRQGKLKPAKPGAAPLPVLRAPILPPPPLTTVPDGEGHPRCLALSVSSCAAALLVSGHMLQLPLRAYS